MELKPTTAHLSLSPARSPSSRKTRIFSARWARLSENLRSMREADRLLGNLSRLDYLFELDARKSSYSAKLGKHEIAALQGKGQLISEVNMLYGAITPEKAKSAAAAYKRAGACIRTATTIILGTLGAGNLALGIRMPDLTPLIMGTAFIAGGFILNLKFPKLHVQERTEWIIRVLEKARKQARGN